MKRKYDYISIFKFIAIILVIIGHVPNISDEIKNYIYSFHMPLFFMLYGFIKFDASTYNDINIFKNLERKLRSLLIPYFIWAFIYSGLSIISIKAVLYGSHISLKEFSNSSLWFLPTYFISVVFFDVYQYLLSKHYNRKHCYMIDMLSFVISFLTGYLIPNFKYGFVWGMDISLIGFALMLLGKNIRLIFDKIKINYYNFHTSLILLILFGTSIFIYKLNYTKYMLMAEKNIGNPFIFIFVSFLGFIFIYIFAILLSKIGNQKIKKMLIYIGDNTLVFLALQRLVINMLYQIFSIITVLPNYLSNLFIVFFSTIVLTIIAFIINMYIPELNGKKYNNT